MLFAKVLTVIIAGVFTILTARRLMNEVNAAKVRAKPRQPSKSISEFPRGRASWKERAPRA